MTRRHITLEAGTHQSVGWPVSGKRFTGAAIDPTNLPVAFSFTPTLAPGAFTPGSWQADTSTSPATYWAVVRVGSIGTGATKELAPGTYFVRMRLTDSPATPVLDAGTLTLEG